MFNDGLRPPVKLMPIKAPDMVAGAAVTGNYDDQVSERGKTFLLTVINLLSSSLKMYGNEEELSWDGFTAKIWPGLDVTKASQKNAQIIQFVGKKDKELDWGELKRVDYDLDGETDSGRDINDAIPFDLYLKADPLAQVNIAAAFRQISGKLSDQDSFWEVIRKGDWPTSPEGQFNFLVGLLDAKRDWVYGLSALGLNAYDINDQGARARVTDVFDSWKIKESGSLNSLILQNYSLGIRGEVAGRFNSLSGQVYKGEIIRALYDLYSEQSNPNWEELEGIIERVWSSLAVGGILGENGYLTTAFTGQLAGLLPAESSSVRNAVFNVLNNVYKTKKWFNEVCLPGAKSYFTSLVGNSGKKDLLKNLHKELGEKLEQLLGTFKDGAIDPDKLGVAQGILQSLKAKIQGIPNKIEELFSVYLIAPQDVQEKTTEIASLITGISWPTSPISAGVDLLTLIAQCLVVSKKLGEVDLSIDPEKVVDRLWTELGRGLATDLLEEDLLMVVKDDYQDLLKQPVGYVAGLNGLNSSFRVFNRLAQSRYEQQKEDKIREKTDEARAAAKQRSRGKELKKTDRRRTEQVEKSNRLANERRQEKRRLERKQSAQIKPATKKGGR